MSVRSGLPTFSVIMPVYNHSAYLREAVGSVQRQSFADWQMIIVDDGSTDNSGRIIDELAKADCRIVARRQTNAGPAAARNAGIALATGQWMTYLDSDDLWFPDTLQHYADYIAAHGDARFIYGYRHRLGADGAILESRGEFQDRPTGTQELFGRMFLSHLCVCYRRELLDEAGPYDARLRSCEDYELYLRMSLHCRFDPLGKPTGLRRRHATNVSLQTGFSRLQEARILERFARKVEGRNILQPAQVRSRLGRLYYAAGRQYFHQRCFRQARESIHLAHQHRWTLKGAIIAACATALQPLGRTDGRAVPELSDSPAISQPPPG